jgi:hypothetical protein
MLQGWFEYYNVQYFSSKLPDGVRVEVFFAGAGADGNRNMGITFACDSKARICIFVDPEFNPEWRGRKFTLLHEMVHLKLGYKDKESREHGPKFQHEMHRLADEGAFEDIW